MAFPVLQLFPCHSGQRGYFPFMANNSTQNGLLQLQKILKYRFKNLLLLEQALTHTSWANEHGLVEFHNERLEFLGDAVLELCITEQLYRRYPAAREGTLTGMRSRLVNEPELAALARRLELDRYLRLGKGEEQQGGRHRNAILADAFEALLGAVYEDGGFEPARRILETLYSRELPDEPPIPREKDAKTLILEYCQRTFREPPLYAVILAKGPSHEREFEVEIQLPDGRKYTAAASSTKKAEQAAAAEALQQISAL